MDFLKAEIERKRKERELLEKKIENGENEPKKKKYIRRGELERIQEEEYRKMMEEEEKKREEKRRKKEEENKKLDKIEDETETNEKMPEELERIFQMPENELIRQLRAWGEPILLFGESKEERAYRFRRIQERKEAAEEHISQLGQDEFGKIVRNLEDEEEEDAQVKEKKKKKDEEKQVDESKKSEYGVSAKEDYVVSKLKKWVKTWKQEMDDRSEQQKKSTQGRMESATFKQCKGHLKPLYRQLKMRSLADDLLDPIHDIFYHLEEREYVKAHDVYYRMAIGNAPWPMGVTMVGIHERSAREKIFSNQIAHVLNDDTQRKYIQAIKRLISFAQRLDPQDPSKTVAQNILN